MTLALLITAVGGAWAQGAFSSDPYTSTTEFNSVSVTSSMTLNINEGVIVTVNSGLTIEDGVTLTLTGGGRLSVYGKSGAWGRDAFYEEGNRIVEATAGGDGNPAIILNDNAKIVIDNGEIYAEGGQGGRGGEDATAGINQPDGAAGNAFSRFPTIDGATLYYKSSDEWFKYTSGDQTLYNKMKAVPPTIDVTLNETKTIASFEMPAFDATAEYELVRDMAVDMPVTIGDGKDGFGIRVKNVEGKWELDNLTEEQMMAKVTVRDSIEHKNLVFNGDAAVCDAKIYAIDDDGQPTGDAITSATMAPGSYVIIATAKEGSDYDGTTLASNTFLLYDYINITFPKGYSTHYYNESLVLDETRNSLKFYAVTAVTSEKVTLTEIEGKAIPGGTPFIVYNETAEPITAVMGMLQADDVTSAEQFKGTAEDKIMESQSNCYILRNGDSTPTFRLVEGAGTLPAHRCYIDLGAVARTRSLGFDFGDGTTGIDSVESGELKVDSYYDLQGRKHQGTPQRKGVYVKDGRKVIVR